MKKNATPSRGRGGAKAGPTARSSSSRSRPPGKQAPRAPRHFGTGRGLEALEAIDLDRVQDFDDLLAAMAKTSFAGRALGEAADVLTAMITDPGCFVVATLAGAMTVAKQALVLCDMIDRGWVQALVSTGAAMSHGLVEGAGYRHYKVPSDRSDADLYREGYYRVYDSLELEHNFLSVASIMEEAVAMYGEGETACSHTLLKHMGRILCGQTKAPGILKSAFRNGVSVFVPAFSDSELGMDFALDRRRRQLAGKPPVPFDPILDLEAYGAQALQAPRLGIFTVGGGVPRNWAQQVGPYFEYLNIHLRAGFKQVQFRYGVRLCPEPTHFGGLSGCTYQEGVSWGKFAAPSDGGRYAEVYADATIAWPLLVKGVGQRLEKQGLRAAYGPKP
ncbi:MAG: deoxyhypusine synthase family protein [Planctomycetes bacterium]|nr:deoxyhypusine synthase family protein [Planctomycetota bacterium]